MNRESCLDCVRKHIAQASILCDEARLGYPHHKWYAAGHLAEAESECLREFPLLAQEIRECRLQIMSTSSDISEVCTDTLLLKVCKLAGDTQDLIGHPNNSKQFVIPNKN